MLMKVDHPWENSRSLNKCRKVALHHMGAQIYSPRWPIFCQCFQKVTPLFYISQLFSGGFFFKKNPWAVFLTNTQTHAQAPPLACMNIIRILVELVLAKEDQKNVNMSESHPVAQANHISCSESQQDLVKCDNCRICESTANCRTTQSRVKFSFTSK